MMNVLSDRNTGILQFSGKSVKRLTNQFYTSGPKKSLFGCFYHRPQVAVSQGRRKQNEYLMEKELEKFDRIFKEHKENQSQNPTKNTINSLTPDVTKINGQDSALMPESSLLQSLQDSKVNLVLVATSLDEKDVVKKLEGTLDPAKSSMIPLTFIDDKTNSSSNETVVRSGIDSHSNSDGATGKDERQLNYSKSGQNGKKEKDAQYWKRRISNNEAAKKSRDARKLRFDWIENRTKELEVENASLREQLEALTNKVLEKERKFKLES